MAFAIFYELSDLSAIAGSAQALSLSNTLRQRVKKYWDGGLSGWETAPIGQAPGSTSAPLSRQLVISGAGNTLADFRQLLLDIAAFLGGDTGAAAYLITLSGDMVNGGDGAREPWPPV